VEYYNIYYITVTDQVDPLLVHAHAEVSLHTKQYETTTLMLVKFEENTRYIIGGSTSVNQL
jgi:hypothetical protein